MANKSPIKRIWWLSGDRYFTIAKKKSIIDNLNEECIWNIEDISSIEDSNDFAKRMFSKDLFDIQSKIFIYDGKHLPDAEACYSIIENMNNDKALIIITSSVDKRTRFAKIFKEYLQEFESAKDNRGFIDEKNLNTGMIRCKQLIKWSGSNELFDILSENSEYDYGCIIEEIKKLRIYTLKDDVNITIDDYYEIGCFRKSQYGDLLNCIKERNKIEAFRTLSEIMEDISERSEWISILYLILETFDLFLFCKLIDPNGICNKFSVGSNISKLWLKKGENVNTGTIAFRYDRERQNIAKRDILSITKSISILNKAIINLIHNKNINHSNIIKSTIWKIL